ncbi:MAG: hypothetical protein IPN84_17450 [Sphingomonadales bacterium]|jgi:hypothetical protein|nr:hypothetical protein [Sphingomonadales bacterium]
MSGIGERRGLTAATYRVFVVAGWLTVTLLIAIGVICVFFVMFANGTAEGTFAEAENLARHFLDADASRRAAFLSNLQTGFLMVALIVGAFRVRCLVELLTPGDIEAPVARTNVVKG